MSVSLSVVALHSRGMGHRDFWHTYGHLTMALGKSIHKAFEEAMIAERTSSNAGESLEIARRTSLGKKLLTKVGQMLTLSQCSKELEKLATAARRGVGAATLSTLKVLINPNPKMSPVMLGKGGFLRRQKSVSKIWQHQSPSGCDDGEGACCECRPCCREASPYSNAIPRC